LTKCSRYGRTCQVPSEAAEKIEFFTQLLTLQSLVTVSLGGSGPKCDSLSRFATYKPVAAAHTGFRGDDEADRAQRPEVGGCAEYSASHLREACLRFGLDPDGSTNSSLFVAISPTISAPSRPMMCVSCGRRLRERSVLRLLVRLADAAVPKIACRTFRPTSYRRRKPIPAKPSLRSTSWWVPFRIVVIPSLRLRVYN
jgi:hypothetical protein